MTLKRVRGEVAFDGVTFSYDGKLPAVEDLTFKAEPGETIALVGATGAGKSTALALLYRVSTIRNRARSASTARDIRGVKLASAPAQYRRDLPGAAAVQPLDRRESARSAIPTPPTRRSCAGLRAAPRRSNSSSATATG